MSTNQISCRSVEAEETVPGLLFGLCEHMMWSV